MERVLIIYIHPSVNEKKKKKYSWGLLINIFTNEKIWGFPSGPVVRNMPYNVGTPVWSLVWEDPMYLGVAGPVYHSFWAHKP